jgi:hypothetical protein
MAQALQRQIIAAALNLIEDEEHWTRGAIARTADRYACAWNDPGAVRFCAVGALVRVAYDLVGNEGQARELAIRAARQIAAASNRQRAVLPYVNDCEGHAATVAMFKRALSGVSVREAKTTT